MKERSVLAVLNNRTESTVNKNDAKVFARTNDALGAPRVSESGRPASVKRYMETLEELRSRRKEVNEIAKVGKAAGLNKAQLESLAVRVDNRLRTPNLPGEAATGDARRRRIRTRVQAAIASCAVLLGIVPLVLDAVEGHVSPSTYMVLASAAAVITQGAALVTRIMSNPQVKTWVDHYAPWLSDEGLR